MLRLAALLPLMLLSCDYSAAKDPIQQCGLVCVTVESCGVTPPEVQLDGMTATSGSGGVDCAANCAQEDMRAFYGYSDCQITCLAEAACDEMESCWDVSSDRYASYCLGGRTTTPVAPGADDAQPNNGTTTGSAAADDVVDNPAVEAAVEGASDDDFVVNYGDTPPQILGHFHAVGTIDASSNARPVGSPINTTLCFSNPVAGPDGVVTDYCEDNVPGTATAPITGSGDAFTMYLEYTDEVTILFSGTVGMDGNPSNVEALVVYLTGIDVWELSHTDWEWVGECNSCE